MRPPPQISTRSLCIPTSTIATSTTATSTMGAGRGILPIGAAHPHHFRPIRSSYWASGAATATLQPPRLLLLINILVRIRRINIPVRIRRRQRRRRRWGRPKHPVASGEDGGGGRCRPPARRGTSSLRPPRCLHVTSLHTNLCGAGYQRRRCCCRRAPLLWVRQDARFRRIEFEFSLAQVSDTRNWHRGAAGSFCLTPIECAWRAN